MKHLLLPLLLVFYLQSQAQLPDYYIYLVKGNASITNAGKKPVMVKQKQLVFKNDVLSIGKGAELTLVDRNANYYVIKTEGSNKVSGLIRNVIAKAADGLTAKYLKLLFHELLDPNHDFDKLKKENIAGAWGGVSRGDECENRICPVNGLQTSAGTIIFRWHKTSRSSNYLLAIYDQDGGELSGIKVKDTLHSVNVAEIGKGRTGKYFWRVTSEDGICEDEIPIYFNLLTPENEKLLTEQLIGNSAGTTLEEKLQQIEKLEKNAFIDAAAARYFLLVKSNMENKALLKSYVLFLIKYGFEEEARTMWNSLK